MIGEGSNVNSLRASKRSSCTPTLPNSRLSVASLAQIMYRAVASPIVAGDLAGPCAAAFVSGLLESTRTRNLLDRDFARSRFQLCNTGASRAFLQVSQLLKSSMKTATVLQ